MPAIDVVSITQYLHPTVSQQFYDHLGARSEAIAYIGQVWGKAVALLRLEPPSAVFFSGRQQHSGTHDFRFTACGSAATSWSLAGPFSGHCARTLRPIRRSRPVMRVVLGSSVDAVACLFEKPLRAHTGEIEPRDANFREFPCPHYASFVCQRDGSLSERRSGTASQA